MLRGSLLLPAVVLRAEEWTVRFGRSAGVRRTGGGMSRLGHMLCGHDGGHRSAQPGVRRCWHRSLLSTRRHVPRAQRFHLLLGGQRRARSSLRERVAHLPAWLRRHARNLLQLRWALAVSALAVGSCRTSGVQLRPEFVQLLSPDTPPDSSRSCAALQSISWQDCFAVVISWASIGTSPLGRRSSQP